MIKRNCLWCKKELFVFNSQLKNGEGKFCSKKCKDCSQRGKQIEWLKNLDRKYLTGKNNPNWKETGFTYESLHLWLDRWYKKDKCEICKITKNLEWANKSGEYLRDRKDFRILCLRCHRRVDKKNPKSKKGILVIKNSKRYLT